VIYAFGNPVYDRITTPRVNTQERVLSGCSTNFALALARLGHKVTPVGTIGKDFGAHFHRALSTEGIGAVVSESSETGGFALHYYDDRGNRTLDLLGRAKDIDFIPPETAHAEAVMVGPILGETGFPLIRKLRKSTDGILMLDPQGLLRTTDGGTILHFKPDGIEELIGLFDVVKPNEVECKVLTGIDPREDARTAAETIFSWGPGLVVITLAEEGSVVYDGLQFQRIPAYPADVVDATGAGDTYAAGFMHGLLRGASPRECGIWGTAVASIMIEHVGPDFPLTGEEASRRAETITAATEVAA
jgi:sugar/nucleoside kinase (ribokinase family)